MNRLKTLFKIEAKATMLMPIYFILLGIVMAVVMNHDIREIVGRDLYEGIDGFRYYQYSGTEWGRLFADRIMAYTIFAMLGVLLLIYISYRNDKNHEVGRFLQSLPYTNRERYLVKIGVGIMSFSIPHLLFGIIAVLLRKSFLIQMKDVYEATILCNVYEKVFSEKQLIQILMVAYLTIVAFYLFVMMFEYIISFNLASLIIAGLTVIYPLLVLANMHIHQVSRKIYGVFVDWLSLLMLSEGNWGEVKIAGTEEEHIQNSFDYIDFVGVRVALFVGIILICFIITLIISKNRRLEQMDDFIPSKIFRIIFLIGMGTGISMLFAGGYWIFFNNSHAMLYIAHLLGAVIGTVVGWKLIHIGRIKHKANQVQEVSL